MSSMRPNQPLPGRPDGDRLTGTVDDPTLAPMLAALTAPAAAHELEGIAPALAALRTAQVTSIPSTTPRRRPSMFSTLAGAKLGATIAGIAVGLGGAATVVYASANGAGTPDTHATVAVTPTQAASGSASASTHATGTPTPSGTAVGPDATGPAAHGLCTAWKAVAGNGKAVDSVAFANLAEAAGGEDKIAAWCATVTAPGGSADHATGKPSTAPTGKPESVPTGKPESTPTGKPESVPTGRPTTVPAPSATGRP